MKKKTWKIIVRHLVLALLAIIWLIPIVWLVVTSLSTTKGVSYQHFFPEHWTLANYHQLFFKTDTAANFPAWFKNTFIVAFFTCIVSSAFVLMVSYAFSCMRFKGRKQLMSFSILHSFPKTRGIPPFPCCESTARSSPDHRGCARPYSSPISDSRWSRAASPSRVE